MKLCLDTNAISALMSEGDEERKILAQKAVEEADRVYVPSVALGEILYGFALGTREESLNRARLRDILEVPGVSVASVDRETAERYARVNLHLRKIGKPIPQNDVWIASIALNLGATLLTFDSHFRHVPGLMVSPE